MRDYLFRRTEQAGTYFKICHLLYHSTYICPILFSPNEHGEISIFVSLKLYIRDFPSIILYNFLNNEIQNNTEVFNQDDWCPL